VCVRAHLRTRAHKNALPAFTPHPPHRSWPMIVPYANQEMQINGVVAVIVEKDCPAQNNARHYNGKEVATAVMNSNEYALTLFGVAVSNSCANCVEELFHRQLKSYANKLFGCIPKWSPM